ncbi:MAG TPA: transcriptional regulator [Tepidisphaeraceae bacterium]|nr:transcriptional regulator [Tepidisphaeraceae bacterium]
MPFDPLIANPGRLRILTALATEPRQEFVRLRERTRLTDGNLATHARRLCGAGFIMIEKSIRSGKPVTSFEMTLAGRQALEAHAHHLLAALRPPQPPPAVHDEALAAMIEADDDWVD